MLRLRSCCNLYSRFSIDHLSVTFTNAEIVDEFINYKNHYDSWSSTTNNNSNIRSTKWLRGIRFIKRERRNRRIRKIRRTRRVRRTLRIRRIRRANCIAKVLTTWIFQIVSLNAAFACSRRITGQTIWRALLTVSLTCLIKTRERHTSSRHRFKHSMLCLAITGSTFIKIVRS